MGFPTPKPSPLAKLVEVREGGEGLEKKRISQRAREESEQRRASVKNEEKGLHLYKMAKAMTQWHQPSSRALV